MRKYKLRVLNVISSRGLDKFPMANYESAEDIKNPDAILLRSFDMHEMDFPDSLLAIGRAGAGVNNIPVERATKNGIPVFNAPGANANAVKELVVAGMLMASRNISQGWSFSTALKGTDGDIHKQVEAGKKQFAGFELPGRTLGVVGLGEIGVKVANVAVALGMNVIGYDPQVTVKSAWKLSSSVRQGKTVDELLAASDYVTFHVPLIDATRHLINQERLLFMRDNVIILNFSRAGIVDDEAVSKAIESGKVYGYVCDFPTNLLKDNSRVITLPHLGASTLEAEENCAIMIADEIRDYLENGNITNAVNFPDVLLERKGKGRLAVINSNVPDMLGNISHVLGQTGCNITHMVNDSKNGIAYTLVDVDSEIADSVISKVADIKGVIRVRKI